MHLFSRTRSSGQATGQNMEGIHSLVGWGGADKLSNPFRIFTFTVWYTSIYALIISWFTRSHRHRRICDFMTMMTRSAKSSEWTENNFLISAFLTRTRSGWQQRRRTHSALALFCTVSSRNWLYRDLVPFNSAKDYRGYDKIIEKQFKNRKYSDIDGLFGGTIIYGYWTMKCLCANNVLLLHTKIQKTPLHSQHDPT